MSLEFGIKVKDTVTGFTGTVTGKVCYITGCDQYLVQPPMNKQGVFIEPRWMDEGRLEQIGKETTLHTVQSIIGKNIGSEKK